MGVTTRYIRKKNYYDQITHCFTRKKKKTSCLERITIKSNRVKKLVASKVGGKMDKVICCPGDMPLKKQANVDRISQVQ